MIFQSFAFPIFFRTVLLADSKSADAWWGVVVSGTAATAALIAPMLGRYADRVGRYHIFKSLAIVSFMLTFAVSLTVGSHRSLVIVVFCLASIIYFLAVNLYDSLLPLLSHSTERIRFSGFAWGFGYIGGIVCFLILLATGMDDAIQTRGPYIITALFYAGFGLMSVILLKRHLAAEPSRRTRITLRQMLETLTKPRIQLLLGYWLVIDVVNAIIAFIAIYGSVTLEMSTTTIGAYLLLVQIIAFPGTYLVSVLASRFGVQRGIASCIATWILIIVLLSMQVGSQWFFLIAILTALVIGSTQSLMRSQYSSLLDPSRTSEMFGWYAVATKSLAIFAPLLFGLISTVSGSQRLAFAAFVPPLIVGGLLISVGYKQLVIPYALKGR